MALKVLRGWRFSEEGRRRFRLERRVLASLEHPGIARLIDAGSGPDGAPFYAMELIDGRPITQFCDEKELDLEARIRLFLLVCEAVQHAHANLIVHRDLKPGNVLVTAEGRPKVVDFGIAKPLRDLPGLGEPDETREAVRILTPCYASPEQIAGGPITIGSDLYSLGVLLYELLSGCRPFDLEGLGLAEIEQRIGRANPRVPSRRVLELKQRSPEDALSAALRRGRRSPVDLARALRGDLDRILLHCLQKRPERRYPTVAGLVEDLERFLACEPIAARPPGRLYRAGRFVRRHWLVVGSVAALAASTGVFLAVLWGQSRRLAEERDRALEAGRRSDLIARLLVETFERADPAEHLGAEPTAGELAREAAVRIEAELSQDDRARAELLTTLAAVHSGLGERERALELVREAQNAMEAEEAAVSPSRLLEAGILRALDRRTEAAEVAAAVWAARRDRFGPGDPRSLLALAARARSLGSLGRDEEARRLMEWAVEGLQKAGPEHRLDLAGALQYLSVLDRRLRDFESAAVHLDRAAAIIEASYPVEHPRVSLLHQSRGNLAKRLGRPREAVDHYGAALAANRKIYGEGHERLAPILYNLGITYRDDLGEPELAHRFLSEAVVLAESRLGADNWNVAIFRGELGDLLTTLGRPEEAIPLLEQSLLTFSSRPEANGTMEAHALAYLGRAHLARCVLPQAVRVLEQAVPALEERMAEDDPTLLRARSDLERARSGRSCGA